MWSPPWRSIVSPLLHTNICFSNFCGPLRISDLYKVFVRSEAPTTWPRNSIRHWPLKRSNFLSLPVPSKRRCRRQTFALYWPIHGQGRNPWFSRFWIGDRLLFPQIAILKLKIKQNEFFNNYDTSIKTKFFNGWYFL